MCVGVTGVHGCVRTCTGVCRCVQVYAGVTPLTCADVKPVMCVGVHGCVRVWHLGAELWAGELSEAAGGVGPVDVEVAQHRRCELRGARRVVTHHLVQQAHPISQSPNRPSTHAPNHLNT
jgi:hypothetical protein